MGDESQPTEEGKIMQQVNELAQNGKFCEARSCIEKLIDMREKRLGKGHSDVIWAETRLVMVMLIEAATVAQTPDIPKDEVLRCAGLCMEAMQMAKKHNGWKDLNVAFSALYGIGTRLYVSELPAANSKDETGADGILLIEESLRIIKQLQGEGSSEVKEVEETLAMCMLKEAAKLCASSPVSIEQVNKAADLCRRVLETNKHITEFKNVAFPSAVMHNLGTQLMKKDDVQTARFFFENAVKIIEKDVSEAAAGQAKESEHATELCLLLEAAVICHNPDSTIDDVCKAAELCTRANEISEKHGEWREAKLAFATFHNTGLELCKKGEYAKGRNFFQDALEIAEKISGSDSHDAAKAAQSMIVGCLLNEAGVLCTENCSPNEVKQAAEQCKKAIQLAEKQGEWKEPAHAFGTLHAVGLALFRVGSVEEGKILFDRLREIAQKYFGDESDERLVVSHSFAAACLSSGDVETATAQFLNALAIAEKKEKANPEDTKYTHAAIQSLAALGRAAAHAGLQSREKERFQQARGFYERVIKKAETLRSGNDRILAETSVAFGWSLLFEESLRNDAVGRVGKDNENVNEALKWGQRGLDLAEKHKFEDLFHDTFYLLSQACEYSGRYEEALPYAERLRPYIGIDPGSQSHWARGYVTLLLRADKLEKAKEVALEWWDKPDGALPLDIRMIVLRVFPAGTFEAQDEKQYVLDRTSKPLGDGVWSNVFRGTQLSDGAAVAVKIVSESEVEAGGTAQRQFLQLATYLARRRLPDETSEFHVVMPLREAEEAAAKWATRGHLNEFFDTSADVKEEVFTYEKNCVLHDQSLHCGLKWEVSPPLGVARPVRYSKTGLFSPCASGVPATALRRSHRNAGAIKPILFRALRRPLRM